MILNVRKVPMTATLGNTGSDCFLSLRLTRSCKKCYSEGASGIPLRYRECGESTGSVTHRQPFVSSEEGAPSSPQGEDYESLVATLFLRERSVLFYGDR